MYSDIKDLTGKTVGNWTIIRDAGRASNNEVLWECQCVCGTIRKVRGGKLRQNKSLSCGCTTKKKDISGQTLGDWKVIRRTRDHNGTAKWLCENGDTYAMLDTTQLKKGSITINKGIGEWKMVGESGNKINKDGKEWILASHAPKNGMIVVKCEKTGVVAVFDKAKFNEHPSNFHIIRRERSSSAEDLAGKTYESWLVLDKNGCNKHGQAMWKCECQSCGIIKNIVGFALKRGTGCRNCNKIWGRQDHSGKTYGVWKLLNRGTRKCHYECECMECGAIKSYHYSQLNNKTPKCQSCKKSEVSVPDKINV
jgi:hypothetical protein